MCSVARLGGFEFDCAGEYWLGAGGQNLGWFLVSLAVFKTYKLYRANWLTNKPVCAYIAYRHPISHHNVTKHTRAHRHTRAHTRTHTQTGADADVTTALLANQGSADRHDDS